MLKSEIRILGFDDGPFESRENTTVPLVGVVFRGGNFLDGVLRTDVEVDGMDATEKMERLINSSRHKQQLKVIMLDGITVGGFNIIDIQKIYGATKIPVIVVNRKRPNLENVKRALENFGDFEERWKVVENAGEIKSFRIKKGAKIFYQSCGIDDKYTREIVDLSCTRSQIPEPLRVAHLFAGAIVRGESYGRA